MKHVKLSIKDLLELELESNGYGLFKSEARSAYSWTNLSDPYAMLKRIDLTVIKSANELKWTRKELFQFMDSKEGRWAGEELSRLDTSDFDDSEGPDEVKLIIAKYMKEFKESVVQ